MNKIQERKRNHLKKKKKPRVENTIIEWKNSTGSFKSGLFESKRISDLEDKTFEIIQSMGQKSKRLKKDYGTYSTQ